MTYDPGTLYLQILSVSNNIWVAVCGMTNGTSGEILYRQTLDSGGWLSEGSLVSTNDNFNLVMLTMNNRTNSLFLTCRSPADSSALPLWWQLKYFAATAVSGTDDLDGDGVSNLAEFLRGTDPNKLNFEPFFDNDHIRGDSVSGTIQILAGVPAEVAILVNDSPTNLSAVSWVPYSSNFTAALPPVDGPNTVLVGLRGFAGADSLQTWRGSTIWRDTQAPLLVITNPASNTGPRPLIQIKGYSPEPIMLTWAVTNALGGVVQGKGLSVGQLYDTSALDLSTNFFECLDIPLALGTNSVGLSATDRAGNLAQTNLVYVFDTNGAVAPVLTVTWPQDGTKLSANTESFTLLGRVDDETASIVGQIVAPDGTTNAINALVERNGKYWVEDLPIAAGTNAVSVTATDAAGISSTTNLFVVKSDVSLTITAVPEAQLYLPTVTVSGSVTGPTNLVWINGLQADVDSGSGAWIATNVPVTPGGRAVFTATAYPPDEAPSGGGAGYNAMTPSSCDTTLIEDKPPRVYIQHYDMSYTSQVGNYTWLRFVPVQENLTVDWTKDCPGANLTYNFLYAIGYPTNVSPGNEVITWPADTYPPTLHADIIAFGTNDLGDGGLPPLSMEQCQTKGTGYFYNIGDAKVESATYARSASTIVMLFTGGPEGIEEQRLHRLTVDLWSRAYQWWFGGGSSIGLSNIAPGATAGVFGMVGPDNNGYEVLAGGKDVVATPIKSGVENQGGGLPSDTDFKLHLSFGGLDVTDTNTPVVAGQKISLSCSLVDQHGSAAPPLITNYQWTIPDYAISNFVANVNTGQVFEVFAKTSTNCNFYWVDGGNKEVQCTIKAVGKQLSAKTVFNVKRPNIELAVNVPGEIRADSNYKLGGTYLHFGGNRVGTNVIPGIEFQALSTDTDGEVSFVQVGTVGVNYLGVDGTNYVGTGTGVDNGTDEGDYIYGLDPAVGDYATDDYPGSLLGNTVTNITRTDTFTMYLMFTPATPGDKMFVPIKKVVWSWSGAAVLTNAPLNLWGLTAATPPLHPAPVEVFRYPEWTNHIQPLLWTPRVPPVQ